MKFTIIATILSFAAFSMAAPIAAPAAEGVFSQDQPQMQTSTDIPSDVVARQNHGMCVAAPNGGEPVQIPNC